MENNHKGERTRESGHSDSRTSNGPSSDPVSPEDETDDDYCVYTYKGGSSSPSALLADLPSSFYNFDQNHLESAHPSLPDLEDMSSQGAAGGSGLLESQGRAGQSGSSNINGRVGSLRFPEQAAAPRNAENIFSPDMDFLEMDFDPGPCPDDEDEVDEDIDDGFPLGPVPKGGLGTASNGENEALNRYILEHAQQAQQRMLRESAIAGDVTDSPTLAPVEPVPVEPIQPQPSSSASCFASGSGLTSAVSTQVNKRPVLAQLGHKSVNNAEIPIPMSTRTETTQLHSLALEPAARPQQTSNPCRCEARNEPVLPSSSGTNTTTPENSAEQPTGSPSLAINPGILLRLVKSNTLPEIGTSNSNSSIVNRVEAGGKSESLPVVSNAEMSDTVELEIGSLMIWTVEEALERGLTQIGTSACGATAVCSVVRALETVPVLDTAYVNECVSTRLRDNDAEIPEYLFSRASAGATHEDLIRGCSKVTSGRVFGRFFQVPPQLSERSFSKWLLHWICRGAIPVLTRNLQHVPKSSETSQTGSTDLPDAWHHQMVHGMSATAGVYLTNPVECVPLSEVLPQLSTPSVLLVRRADIISRMRPNTDLRRLAKNHNGDPRWTSMNVLGQVGNILLEGKPLFHGTSVGRRVRTSHVQIPASYKGGVTLFISTNNVASLRLLQSAQELM